MPASPLISIIMPVYNAAGFLTRAVQSAQAQTYRNIEILLIDDCSTDNTVEVAQALAKSDPRIRVFRQPQNGGPSAARNRGLQEAKGEWLAVLDADDAYTPQRLERMLQTARDTNADMVADNLRLYDAMAQQESGTAFNWGAPITLPLTIEFLLQNDRIGKGNPLGWIKPIFKKQFLNQHNLTYPTHLRHGEDFYLYVDILMNQGKSSLFNEAHYLYTTRAGAISGKASNQSRTQTDISSLSIACDELLEKYPHTLSTNTRKLFKQRKAECVRYQAFLNLKYHLAKRNLVAVLQTAINNPSAAARLGAAIVGKFKRYRA